MVRLLGSHGAAIGLWGGIIRPFEAIVIDGDLISELVPKPTNDFFRVTEDAGLEMRVEILINGVDYFEGLNESELFGLFALDILYIHPGVKPPGAVGHTEATDLRAI